MDHSFIYPLLLDETINRHAYLIKTPTHKILIDSGAKHLSNQLFSRLETLTKIDEIDYVILQANDYLNISGLDPLTKKGFKGTLIANEAIIPFIHQVTSLKVETISQLNFELKLPNLTLEFITLPFLAYPESFVTYYSEEKTLFSGHFFSMAPQSIAETDFLSRINRFHETNLPSSDFVRHGLKKLRKYQIEHIYPRLGDPILPTEVESVFQAVGNFDFYNTSQVIEKKDGKRLTFNYEEICNHMLRKLSTTKRRDVIMNVFTNSEITLGAYPNLEIDVTSLSGYRLWNRFFEIIYEKKGIEWLVLLEPTVNKYAKFYQIQKPSIYKTIIFKQTSALSELVSEKDDLAETVASLKSKIEETTDKLLRCPITGLYTQMVFMQQLVEDLARPLSLGKTRAVLVIHIDNLLQINKKYGAAKGDDTLRGLVHVINQVKHQDTLVFKQNGPGIIVYKDEITQEELGKFALKLKNTIKKSELFIEPITISISVVETSELNPDYGVGDQVNQMIELALSRLERAKLKGKDQVLDKENDVVNYTDGVILLVDEDETNQNLMMTIFKRINYSVMIASDIYQAYELIEHNQIDVIISEINLSKLDGFQLKQKLNATKNFKSIPFIITSHHKNPNVITRCNLLEVDLILQKPIIPEELIGHIKRFKDRRRV